MSDSEHPNDAGVELARRALHGDKAALEALLGTIQSPVYNLALRMLQSPEDAEDAAQEILIKVVTHLGQFRGESAFTTWVYRIASNHLLNTRRRGGEQKQLSFEALGEALERGLGVGIAGQPDDDDERLREEVRRACTLGMLLCLSRDLRIALILGELFELSGDEAAYILEVTPEAFRKRLSRARALIVGFVSSHCGIVNPNAPCRCAKQIPAKRYLGQIDPARLQYAGQSDVSSMAAALEAQRQELVALRRTAALLRAHPAYQASEQYLTAVRRAVGIA
jgi:RNA polymerase sigma factor (sigma-70 family)